MAKNDDGRTMDVGAEDQLQRQLDDIKKAQAGSDRRVQELSQENETLKQKLEEQNAKGADKTKRREALLDRKEKALTLALEKGIRPEEAFTLLGLDGTDDERRLDLLSERDERTRLSVADEFAKKNGRKVRVASIGGAPTYDDLLGMHDDDLRRMGDAEFSRAMDDGKRKNGETKRAQILRDLAGGQ